MHSDWRFLACLALGFIWFMEFAVGCRGCQELKLETLPVGEDLMRACHRGALYIQIPKLMRWLKLLGLGKLMSTAKCVSSDNIQSALGFLHQ